MQARNQRGRRGASPPAKLFAPFGKMRWTKFKTTGHSLKSLATLRKHFAPLDVPSWLLTWVDVPAVQPTNQKGKNRLPYS